MSRQKKQPNSSFNGLVGFTIKPWIGSDVVLTCTVVYRLASLEDRGGSSPWTPQNIPPSPSLIRGLVIGFPFLMIQALGRSRGLGSRGRERAVSRDLGVSWAEGVFWAVLLGRCVGMWRDLVGSGWGLVGFR